MIAIVDYDAGNLKSVEKALKHLGQEGIITRDREKILQADKVILPGVGSFGDAMEKLHKYDLVNTLKNVVEKEIPFLGICLGMQLLFESSEECLGIKGLEILNGKILKIPSQDGLKIPHMGWNSLSIKPGTRLFSEIEDNSYVYFVHSYYLHTEKESIVAATTDYSVNIHAAIEYKNVFACQFHPEKSGDVGLKILKNFAAL
ncbi:MAG: imidazole glycerol phosphate synthase subunit HisH [Acetivibrio sp.]